jgi:hypothetical protein
LELASQTNYSPYFLRHYERLRDNYTFSGNNNAIIIGHTFGFIFGEINPNFKRNCMSGDIYFIYIKSQFRQDGNGRLIVNLFEKEFKVRYNELSNFNNSNNVFAASIEIRIANKHCIRKNTPFWNKNGFIGDINSDQLTKFIYL